MGYIKSVSVYVGNVLIYLYKEKGGQYMTLAINKFNENEYSEENVKKILAGYEDVKKGRTTDFNIVCEKILKKCNDAILQD